MQHKFDIGDIVSSRSTRDDNRFFYRVVDKRVFNSIFGYLLIEDSGGLLDNYKFLPAYRLVRLDNKIYKSSVYRTESLIRNTERSYAGDF
jgi:hypothetical protein